MTREQASAPYTAVVREGGVIKRIRLGNGVGQGAQPKEDKDKGPIQSTNSSGPKKIV